MRGRAAAPASRLGTCCWRTACRRRRRIPWESWTGSARTQADWHAGSCRCVRRPARRAPHLAPAPAPAPAAAPAADPGQARAAGFRRQQVQSRVRFQQDALRGWRARRRRISARPLRTERDPLARIWRSHPPARGRRRNSRAPVAEAVRFRTRAASVEEPQAGIAVAARAPVRLDPLHASAHVRPAVL